MPIGGSATELNITGAKLKVSGGVQVSGSIAYTTDATGFGSVTAQIDGNNTLNITSGKLTGVTKIERATAATITAITHTNVNNNTTIHIALKNTSTANGSNGGIFITLGTFSNDDNIKVNYTDDYVISPQETGMITLRKVNNVLSVFIREMFTTDSKTFDSTKNRPFYVKDGLNYKYPLYTASFPDAVTNTIGGTQYYVRSTDNGGVISKSRPPKGLPENVVSPTGTLKIGNNSDLTTINYDVYGTGNTEAGSLYRGSTQKARFGLDMTHNEASGSFTDSGVSSGDTYTLYLDKTATTSTDTVSAVAASGIIYFAFHHGTFADSGNPHSDASITAAASAGRFYSDTAGGTYGQGVLSSGTTTDSNKTTYTFTPNFSGSALLVAGGGGGGGHVGGGGGAGGLVYTTGVSSGSKTIVVGNGGTGSAGDHVGAGSDGSNTSFTGLDTAIGGGGGGGYHDSGTSQDGRSGGSGGGGGHGTNGGAGTSGQGHAGGNSPGNSACAGGGGAGGASSTPSANAGHSTPGGPGLDQSSVFGTTYGVSGVFAGGGGGGHRADQGYNAGSGGSGGGGAGGYGANGTSATKHTGGGGGGGSTGSYETGGNGGTGIVILKNLGAGKTIPKITGISNVTSVASKTINYTFNTQGTGIDKVTYKIGSGSEVTTASGVYTLAYTPADFGTTTMTHAYTVDSSGNQLGTKFGPYSVLTKLSNLGHISTPILLFMSMGTTVTDSINSVAFATQSGSFTYDTTNNAITNSGSARMKLDFSSVRTDRATAVSVFYEFYLPSGTTYEYGCSLGGKHDTTNDNQDAYGWHDTTTPELHFYGNGNVSLPSQYAYTNYHGKWIKLGWVREASGNSVKVYVDGVFASTHTPTDGSLTGTGVLSEFHLFKHACYGSELGPSNSYVNNHAISFRNLEIYQASFTDAQILAAYGS